MKKIQILFLILLPLLFLGYFPKATLAVDCSTDDVPACYCKDPSTGTRINIGDTIDRGECASTPEKKVTYYCNQAADGTANLETKIISAPGECTQGGKSTTGVGNKNVKDALGTITPPAAIQQFIQRGGGNGGGAISVFLSSGVILIYSIASIVFVAMILWGAFDWISSGGQKDKVESARKRLTYAFIGIILFSIAFAVINLVGTFTGFSFTTATNNAQCPLREEYYLDGSKCIHKYSTGAECTVHFDEANTDMCQPAPIQ